MRQHEVERAIVEIVRLTNRSAQPLERVLAKAKLSTTQFQTAVKDAEARGYSIRLRDGYVFSRVSVQASPKIKVGSTKPGRYVVGYWSDTHFGCRHAAEDEMIQHRTRCHEAGATVMVHTGDLLDGNRPVLLGDQDHVGFDSQFERLSAVLKKSPPMVDIALDGNHDGYYSSSIGSASGRIVEGRLRELGRQWHFAGVCEGRAEIHGADWYLWHPAGGSQDPIGVTKTLSIKRDNLDEHADVIAMGHLHKFVSASARGTLTVCPGTFQRKASEFANRISGPWDVGGVVVSYDLDKHGLVHAAAADFYPARP